MRRWLSPWFASIVTRGLKSRRVRPAESLEEETEGRTPGGHGRREQVSRMLDLAPAPVGSSPTPSAPLFLAGFASVRAPAKPLVTPLGGWPKQCAHPLTNLGP